METVKVFVSYSHDSDGHRERVLQLTNRLRGDAIDAYVDQYTQHKPPRSWSAWMRRQIKDADYVLVVCTETYKRRFEGDEPRGTGRGAKWEGAIIERELYEGEMGGEDQETRFIPVVFDSRDVESTIPDILRSTTFHDLSDDEGYGPLLKQFRGIPIAPMPPLGTAGQESAPSTETIQNAPICSGPEDGYRKLLRGELGTIRMLGSPDVPNLPVDLLETFVHLDISLDWRTEDRFGTGKQHVPQEEARSLCPDEVMRRAFKQGRVLLVIGDPGSGKTTLMKYYAMACLTGADYQKLGFKQMPLPIYFPLREVAYGPKGRPMSLEENLAKWTVDRKLDISQDQYQQWLQKRRSLVLLDGLDEVRELQDRRRVCRWIDECAKRLPKAVFVVTSRWTGYRKSDQVELRCGHLRADVKDFSRDQQREFINNWFTAAFLKEPRGTTEPKEPWEKGQTDKAARQAQQIIDFLEAEQNKSMQELAAVPLLLQIIAVIWKERGIRPRTRVDLYTAVIRYLLEYRDAARGLESLLSAEQALRVLMPAALWMQEDLQIDEVDKGLLHEHTQDKIRRIDHAMTARKFFENLRDRAGIIADYSTTAYIFRHKSFREYLAGMELARLRLDDKRLPRLAGYLGDDWWEEPLRFFISRADEDQFDGFMQAVFRARSDYDLDVNQQRLVHTMLQEACEIKTEALKTCLDKRNRTRGSLRKRHILDCLKTIDTPEAWDAVKTHAEGRGRSADYARELVLRKQGEDISAAKLLVVPFKAGVGKGPWHHSFEFNAEYIEIHGGALTYSVDHKIYEMEHLRFGKYPVTNKRYRRFIGYLRGQEAELQQILAVGKYAEYLRSFAAEDEGFLEYLGKGQGQWADLFRSENDEDKRFKGADQPVVGISQYAARAYCAWLTELENAHAGQAIACYRLPTEMEWEWAAAGSEARKYPWGKDEPTDEHANYDGKVGTSTPVGSCPKGATPEGLMDMAGNVWEWMQNYYDDDHDVISLRGGSWIFNENWLRCAARVRDGPSVGSNDLGFRVVRSQS